MKFTPTQIDKLIENLPSNITALLFYGPDNGLIIERIRDILKKILNNQFGLSIINFAQIKANHNLLEDEINSIPFGGGRKVIRITSMNNILPVFMQKLLENNKEAIILIESEELPPNSALRKYFENSEFTAAIPCYNDEEAGIKKLIFKEFELSSYEIDEEALEYLSSNLQGDRLLIRNEIAKIFAYLGDEKKLTLSEAVKITGDNLTQIASKLTDKIYSGRVSEVIEILRKLIKFDIPLINLIRMNIRYLLQIYNLHSIAKSNNVALNIAVKSLRPPVFFKQLPIILYQAKKWDIDKITIALEKLGELEAECKLSNPYNQILAEKTFLEIARLAN